MGLPEAVWLAESPRGLLQKNRCDADGLRSSRRSGPAGRGYTNTRSRLRTISHRCPIALAFSSNASALPMARQ